MSDIVVTGAASGIGLATARRLAGAGDRVWCIDYDYERLDAQLRTGIDGGDVIPVHLDVASEPDVVETFAAIATQADGSLDGLVNCAGVIDVKRFEALSADDWSRVFSVNVIGTYLTMREAVPLIRKGGGGSIVNIASMAGKIPGPYTAPYSASKAAVINLTRTAAKCFGPAIRVNAVCPGVVKTPMYELIDAGFAAVGAPASEQSTESVHAAPLDRAACPEEIASVVEFLLSDRASYLTGEDLNVTGGFVMY